MTCTGVDPCLSSSLAKNNHVLFMFVQIFQLFGLNSDLVLLRKFTRLFFTEYGDLPRGQGFVRM